MLRISCFRGDRGSRHGVVDTFKKPSQTLGAPGQALSFIAHMAKFLSSGQ
jgi:hypothetical protein